MDMFGLNEGWVWIIGGLLLVLSEFAVPGFVVCFFGVSAWVVGVLTWVFPGMGEGVKWLVCGGGGLALLRGCRRYMPQAFRGDKRLREENPDDDELAGSRAVVREAIGAEWPGKVEFRGSLWGARGEGGVPLEAGTVVEVVRRDNLELVVRRAGGRGGESVSNNTTETGA